MCTTLPGWKELAQAGKLEEAMVAYVEENDYVTFAELSLRLGEYFNGTGDWALELWPNGILWTGMSEDFLQAYLNLKNQGIIDAVGVAPLVYLMDGAVLNLPVPKRLPRDKVKGYAKPYWLPICLRPGDGKQQAVKEV
jgi:hypothetical protein